MTMKLYASLTSPYARKVRVAIAEWQLQDRTELVVTDPWASPPEFLARNPLAKVPALLGEDGIVLPDSQLVLDYLATLAGRSATGNTPARWNTARRAQLADGVIDAAVNIVIERRRPPELQYAGWLLRQSSAIDRALDALEAEAPEIADADPAGLESITLGCAFGYLDFRMPQHPWRDPHPRLAAWYAGYLQRPSMQVTTPPG